MFFPSSIAAVLAFFNPNIDDIVVIISLPIMVSDTKCQTLKQHTDIVISEFI